MINFILPRLEKDERLKSFLLPFCRIKPGMVWTDLMGGHKIGCLDASEEKDVRKILDGELCTLAVHDPPYNFIAFNQSEVDSFISWCGKWVDNTCSIMKDDSSLYVWMGAEQYNHFQPLAEFVIMMRQKPFISKSFITLRNQRGYGTQKNWMCVRQELLYYVKGSPEFDVNAEYTRIPKRVKGYYKSIGGRDTENLERSRSGYIRSGNVWTDIQQVFYRMEENVNGCFAQKPLKAIERIMLSASRENDIVVDFFAHSGTTLIASEKLNRRCFTFDLNPIFCEITLRRLEHFRKTGKTGWQNSNPFAAEILTNDSIMKYLKKEYGLVI